MKLIKLIILEIITGVPYCMAQQEKLPNVVFILADDLGYSDLAFTGQKQVQTPNIDKMAKQGVYFTNAYTACPVSSPTRASILTGKYPAELKLTCHIPGRGLEKYKKMTNKGYKMTEAFFLNHLKADEQTLARLMKKKEYQTAFMGKWHLAGEGSIYTNNGVVDADYHPDRFGFDLNIGGCSYGQPASYFSPYKNATLSDGPNGEYLTDRLGDEAVDYIQKNKENPFFLYLSFHSVHTPYQVPKVTIQKNNGNKYYAMIQKLDENVGKVLRCLEEQNIENNTLVVFYSDNGGLQENPPLNGKKGDLLEGGIRVPLIFKWPKYIKPATICDEAVTSIDFYPTFEELIYGSEIDKVTSNRGLSLLPLLKNKKTHLAERSLFWHYPHHRRGTNWAMGGAIRKGDWKLIQLMETNEIKLFHLKKDEKEQQDLSKINSKKATELLRELTNWQRSVDAEMPIPAK